MYSVKSAIQEHYGIDQLQEAIINGLKKTGKDPEQLSADDLASVDEFHIRGRESTARLLQQVNIGEEDKILDVGCGLGGACRYIASNYDAEVIGIDITETYCKLARRLTESTGLSDRIRYIHADALELPFEDKQFDMVLTLHTQMNIERKKQFYGEIYRVLKPGGRLAFYDIFAGDAPVIYPVPWANDPSINSLITVEDIKNLLAETGFQIDHWHDDTESGLRWFQETINKVKKHGPPPLGLHLLMGSDAPRKMKNVAKNLNENRIRLIEGIAAR